MTEVRLFSIAHLGEIYPCSDSTLGLQFTIVVNGVTGTLGMPGPATQESGREGKTLLLSPPKSYVESKGPGCDRWGYATFPNMRAVCAVERVFLHFDVPAHLQKQHANAIQASLLDWRNSFVGHLELLTKYRLYPAVVIKNHDRMSVRLFIRSPDGKLVRPRDETPLAIYLMTGNPDVAAKPDNLALACRRANMGLPAEYALQLASYRAFGREDNRKAIIETAAAAEICLTSAIMQKFQADGVGYGDKLLGRFRMLGGRIELARILQLPIGNGDVQKELVDPRNSVMHNGTTPDRLVAKNAIRCCDDLLEKLSPLPS